MLPDVRTEIPGPESRRLAAELRRHESQNVTFVSSAFPVFWERAGGVNVWDVDGNRFLDFTSAFAVTGLGHGSAKIREALHTQADRLIHAMGDVHPTRGKAELCRAFSEITFERWQAGEAKTLLGCSGSDAVEAALKTALLHTKRSGVISFEGGYHGLGLGALETIGIPFFRNPFRPQLAEFATQLPYPRTAAACAEVLSQLGALLATEHFGAVLVEPVQGRGGEVVPHPEFLPGLRAACDRHGTLFIADEIYTGFHRAGALFACEAAGIVPDLICLGKGLTSGFPLSACVGKSPVMDAWPESSGEALHTSTFLGHPIGCAMALASIREHLKPETFRMVQLASANLDHSLRNLRADAIREIRGAGLMRGIELVKPDGSPDSGLAAVCVTRALADGLLLLAGSPSGNVLSLTPPFEISEDEIAFAVGKIQEYVTSRAGSIS